MKTVRIYKAQGVNGADVEDVNIEITRAWSDTDGPDFKANANLLAETLYGALPGGVIDALLVELLDRTRSRIVVPHRRAGKNPDLAAPYTLTEADRKTELWNILWGKFDIAVKVVKEERGVEIDRCVESFRRWVTAQAATGDSEADEYLGLVNQK